MYSAMLSIMCSRLCGCNYLNTCTLIFRFGRKKVCIVAGILCSLVGIAQALSVNGAMYSVTKVLTGLTAPSFFSPAFALSKFEDNKVVLIVSRVQLSKAS